MTLTRADVETILIRRVGSILTAASLDGTTVDGSNVDLNDPIGYSIQKLGETVDSLVLVDDDDVARVDDSDQPQLLDVAELRALESAYSSLARLVDIAMGPRKEALSQSAKTLQEDIKRKSDKIENEYGVGASVPVAGRVIMDFAQHIDT